MDRSKLVEGYAEGRFRGRGRGNTREDAVAVIRGKSHRSGNPGPGSGDKEVQESRNKGGKD